jgi:hypothetical protein
MEQTATDERAVLEALQADWPRWNIWRALRDGVPRSWMASRLDPAAGPDATLMEPTPDLLRAALTDQARRAARGELPPRLSEHTSLYGGGR